MRYHYMPNRMTIIIFQKGNNYDKDVEKLYIAVGMQNGIVALENSLVISQS